MGFTLPNFGGCALPNIDDFGAGGGGGGGGSDLADWTRVDVTDGWTLNDPDSTLSSISNVGGLNKCTVGTDANLKFVDGGTWYKEILTEDGSSFNFNDKPVMVQFYLHLPNIGWYVANDGSGSSAAGGNNRPATGSRVNIVAGITTDPEHFPASAGVTTGPADILGMGFKMGEVSGRHKWCSIYNVGTGSPSGALTTSNSYLPTINSAEYTAGTKSYNRLEWTAWIKKSESLNANGINPGDSPYVKDILWGYRNDDGNRKAGDQTKNVGQRFRIRNNKMYAWVAVSRDAGAGSSMEIDFDVYYRVVQVDGDTNPSGRTGL